MKRHNFILFDDDNNIWWYLPDSAECNKIGVNWIWLNLIVVVLVYSNGL